MKNHSNLINDIPKQLKVTLRAQERCMKKINNVTWSIMFNLLTAAGL